jgi:formylglycine-generating enzyme required for sulfatase activity
MLANFKKDKGDYMGIAGKLNDNAAVTAPVRSFLPNDFGLYNMAGNVNEWVFDVYRPLTSQSLRDVDNHDLNPVRGNKFKTVETDEDGRPVEKDSLGRLKFRALKDDELATRDNIRRGDALNYRDGDKESEAYYDFEIHTLVSDKARVYKGGSWADRAFWLSPGARRFKDEDDADRTLGFRCAMSRMGGSATNDKAGGNQFKVKQRRVDRRYK